MNRYNPWVTRIGLLLMTVLVGLPVYFMVVVSLKTPLDIYTKPSLLLTNPTLENYTQLAQQGFFTNALNSLVLGVSTSVASVMLGVLAAYALARIRFPGRTVVTKMILISYVTPLLVLFIPLSVVIQNLQLGNTLLGIGIVYLVFTVPLSTWFLLGFFRNLSPDMEEAAALDGANLRQILTYIVIPMSAPGVATAVVLTFTMSWGELFLALVFLTSPDTQTLPVALLGVQKGDVQNYGLVMAGAVVASIPALILYYAAQRWVIQGVGAGATKG